MRRTLLLVTAPSAFLLVAACVGEDPDAIGGSGSDAGSTSDASSSTSDGANGDPSDGSSDDGPGFTGPCDFSRPFSKPSKVAELSTGDLDDHPRLSEDGDEVFLSRYVSANPSGAAAVTAAGIVSYSRSDGGAWQGPKTLPVNDLGDGGLMHSSGLSVTANGRDGFFSRHDSYGFGTGISKVTRSGPKQAWSLPIRVVVTDGLGNAAAASSPWINADATRLYFEANSGGPVKLYQAQYNAGGYGPGRLLGFDGDDRSPVLSRDEKRIYFASSRPHPGGVSGALVYTSTRTTPEAPFGPVEFVTELNEGFADMKPTWLSADGCTMLLAGHVSLTTSLDVYVATKPSK